MSSDDLSGPALKLLDSVESVTIIEGHIPSDPTIWQIQIAGRCIEVNAENMVGPTVFRKKYLKFFYRPSPPIKKDEWSAFVDLLGDMAEVVVAKEESTNVYLANQIIEKIREMPVTDDQVDAVTGRALLRRDGYLCLLSTKMQEIADEFHVAPNILSTTMTALSYKLEGTPAFRCNGKLCRFWWFEKQAIDGGNPSLPEENKGV